MIVHFSIEGAPPGTYMYREVDAVPRAGETIVWHGLPGDAGLPKFIVVGVTHAYDDRPWYKERPREFGDRVWVTLRRDEG